MHSWWYFLSRNSSSFISDSSKASEIIGEKIKKLIQEKNLLISRLSSLNWENNLNSNSKSQKHRIEQIETICRRVVEIDQNLNKQRYQLSRSTRIQIESISEPLENLTVDTKSKNNKKLKSLKEFINKISEKFVNTPPPHPPVIHLPPTNPSEIGAFANAEAPQGKTSTEQRNAASASNMLTSTSTVTTSISPSGKELGKEIFNTNLIFRRITNLLKTGTLD